MVLFPQTDNYIAGKYLAQVTQEVFADLEASKYQLAEYRYACAPICTLCSQCPIERGEATVSPTACHTCVCLRRGLVGF